MNKQAQIGLVTCHQMDEKRSCEVSQGYVEYIEMFKLFFCSKYLGPVLLVSVALRFIGVLHKCFDALTIYSFYFIQEMQVY